MKRNKNTIKAPAMTRDEWEALPEAVRYFIPWDKARKPAVIKTVGPPDRAKKAIR